MNDKMIGKKYFIIKPLDAHSIQRPETVESLFNYESDYGGSTLPALGLENIPSL